MSDTQHPAVAPAAAPEQADQCLLTTVAVSRRYGISVSTLTKWRVSGGGPRFVKLGSRVAYRAVDLDAFVQERLRRSTSDAA